jgi:hypothetical protein
MSSARDTRCINPRGQVFVQSEVALSPVRTLLTWQRTEIRSPSGCGVWVHPARGSQPSTVQASPSSHEDPHTGTVVEVVLVVATVVVGAIELELLDDVVDELVLLDVDGGAVELVVDAIVLVVDVTTVVVGAIELELLDDDVDVVLAGAVVVVVPPGRVEEVDEVLDEVVDDGVDELVLLVVDVTTVVVVEGGAVEELGTEVDEIEVEDVDAVLVLVVGTKVVDVVIVVPAKVAV